MKQWSAYTFGSPEIWFWYLERRSSIRLMVSSLERFFCRERVRILCSSLNWSSSRMIFSGVFLWRRCV